MRISGYARSSIKSGARRSIHAKHGAHVNEKTTDRVVLAEIFECLLADVVATPEVDLNAMRLG